MKSYPSLTSTSIKELTDHISILTPYVEGFHLDYMDGQFVSTSTHNIELINTIRTITAKQLWIHIMANNPLSVLKQLQLNPNDKVTFHTESTQDYSAFIDYTREHILQPSLALNPNTTLHALINTLYTIKHITIMSVQPGASGQSFLPSTWAKLKDLQALRTDQAHYFTIAVDGGVTQKNIAQLAAYGVNEVAICSGIFGKHDPIKDIKELMAVIENSAY